MVSGSPPRSIDVNRALLDARRPTVSESSLAFPSETQASGLAEALEKLVTRSGKTLNAPTLGSLV